MLWTVTEFFLFPKKNLWIDQKNVDEPMSKTLANSGIGSFVLLSLARLVCCSCNQWIKVASSEHGGERSHSVAVLYFFFFFVAELVGEGAPSRRLQHLRLLCSPPRPSWARHRNAARLRPLRWHRRYPQLIRRSSQRVRRPGPSFFSISIVLFILPYLFIYLDLFWSCIFLLLNFFFRQWLGMKIC